MKKRYTGSIAVVIFGLGFLLSQFWNFGGLGTSEQEGASDGTQNSGAGDAPEPDLKNVSTSNAMTSTVNSTPLTEEGNEEFITIAIHADRYRMTTSEDPHAGVDLPLREVIKQVQRATGGKQGVKLRILFERDAHEGARADLHASLAENGIKREEIQEISGYVD